MPTNEISAHEQKWGNNTNELKNKQSSCASKRRAGLPLSPLFIKLDPKGTITSRLFREHCTFHEGYFVKVTFSSS